MNLPSNTTRRALLKQAAALSFARTATPVAASLMAMANASAQTANDYKALVCIFLFGANDHYNTVLPYDTANYKAYYDIRKGSTVTGPYEGIALTRTSLAATALNVPLSGGRQMALNPQMTGMKTLFDAGRAGIVMNVGPLVVPTTKTQFDNKSVPLPPKLFSHNDQQAYWQSSFQTEGGASGWGGRAADLMLSGNSASALTCISVNGNALYLSGQQSFSYQMSTAGATTVNAIKGQSLFGSSACASALQTLITQRGTHLLGNAHSQITQRALNTYDTVANAIGNNASTELSNLFPTSGTNTLSAQLKMVARLIQKQATLGVRRQVFMVGMGGFDLHDFLPDQHPALLQKLSAASLEFDDAMRYLGTSSQVTGLTASDFGRTLTSNGDGSDHGWGSHHFVMGGAVQGARYFGQAPEIGISHNGQVGSGRLLPSTSTDQMAAELALWFGVSKTDMAAVLPNAKNFDLYQLGFFKT